MRNRSELGGCCIASRYVYSGGGVISSPYMVSKAEQIMLRYRPIAPKPAAQSASSSSLTAVGSGAEVKQNPAAVGGRGGRAKRRCSEIKRSRKRARKPPTATAMPEEGISTSLRAASVSVSGSASSEKESCSLITLPLMPERTLERKEVPHQTMTCEPRGLYSVDPAPKAKSQQQEELEEELGSCSRMGVVVPQPMRRVGSSVTLECITNECILVCNGSEFSMNSLAPSAEEMQKLLEWDESPILVSDSSNRVVWTNQAYLQLVGRPPEWCGGGGRGEMVVLWTREKLPLSSSSFSCRAKIQWSSNTLMVPCDVWRVCSEPAAIYYYAWKLDLKAALCLGR
ncbi:hypothetical protein AMTR_s00020p00118800 [Amborella trichopoda]|uniref:PAS domain-containing protein n=2 Tax=Amborella trichopoda TaxID=13333 RepID=W1PVW3_AMBTC|nr:hypothetical protein AMTR_s00020p00118800 [Amborella trichopoda]